ncbi:hypothetical protein AC1031_008042 [Aphanomyces cochlioides]|nr:hypothetical protein AC1031_008042 [Aphanomyces cochlioides]
MIASSTQQCYPDLRALSILFIIDFPLDCLTSPMRVQSVCGLLLSLAAWAHGCSDVRGDGRWDTGGPTYVLESMTYLLANTDYYGNDIATTARRSPSDCCADCMANPNCVVTVWYDGTCYLKNKVGTRSTLSGAHAIFPTRTPASSAPAPDTKASSPSFKFVNRCSYQIQLYKVDTLVCTLNNGNSCTQSLNANEHTMFRHKNIAEATLVEVTKSGKLWFDVSVVPPGCGNGKSHDECLRNNGGRSGFNVPVSVVPSKYNNTPSKGNCQSNTCRQDNCPEAFTYPSDNLKMRDCPLDELLVVMYCP